MNLNSIIAILNLAQLPHLVDPRRDAHAYLLLEGQAEGAVAAVATASSQLLGRDGTAGRDGLVVKTLKVVDTQTIDVGIVGGILAREILAEVVAVAAQGLRQLTDGEVALQIELRVDAMLLQQGSYLFHLFVVGILPLRVYTPLPPVGFPLAP